MLIVGASVARAFAIVGAASLIRYRSKIDDPKDAGVMLSALAVGLACGVGIYALAAFATAFIVFVLWVIEAFEPQGLKTFELKIKAKDTVPLRNAAETLLRRWHIEYELRTSATEGLTYEVKVPYGRRTDRMSNAILRLDPNAEIAVEWDEKGKKKQRRQDTGHCGVRFQSGNSPRTREAHHPARRWTRPGPAGGPEGEDARRHPRVPPRSRRSDQGVGRGREPAGPGSRAHRAYGPRR